MALGVLLAEGLVDLVRNMVVKVRGQAVGIREREREGKQVYPK